MKEGQEESGGLARHSLGDELGDGGHQKARELPLAEDVTNAMAERVSAIRARVWATSLIKQHQTHICVNRSTIMPKVRIHSSRARTAHLRLSE